jgi:hypothetical protein
MIDNIHIVLHKDSVDLAEHGLASDSCSDVNNTTWPDVSQEIQPAYLIVPLSPRSNQQKRYWVV